MDKETLRKAVIKERLELSNQDILTKSRVICQKIINTPEYKTYSNGNYDVKGRVVRTNNSGLNIRAERNANSEILGTLSEGEIIELDYCIDNWFSIWNNNKIGFVSGKYIDLVK